MTLETPSPLETNGAEAGDGDARVESATADLAELESLPVGEHVERYADVHSRLQDILNEVGSQSSKVD